MTFIRREFETERDARDFMSDYLSRYRREGYGTTLSLETPTDRRATWIVRGSRGGCN